MRKHVSVIVIEFVLLSQTDLFTENTKVYSRYPCNEVPMLDVASYVTWYLCSQPGVQAHSQVSSTYPCITVHTYVSKFIPSC
jgi:hypothetical protein